MSINYFNLNYSLENNPIHIAAMIGNRDGVELLMQLHADINIRNGLGHLPSDVAHLAGNVHVDLLPSINDKQNLFDATLDGNLSLVDLLLSKQADINMLNSEGKTAYELALSLGKYFLVKLFSTHLNKQYKETQMYDVLTNLFKKSLGPIEPPDSLVKHSRMNSKRELLEAFQSDKSNSKEKLYWRLDSSDSYLNLKQLIFIQDVDTFARCIRNYSEINSFDESGNTLLHRAFMVGNFNLCSLLLEKKADINRKNNAGHSSKDIASFMGYINQAYRPINNQNDTYFTAIETGNISKIFYIYDTHADLNIKNEKGQTPFEYAVSINRYVIAKSLFTLMKQKSSNQIKLLKEVLKVGSDNINI
ncbi:MAG: hypothetical protein WDZ28_04995 [Simkaniaceae bacterium]